MPPCLCGLKVERNEEKLICNLCNQIFHPDCCNVRIEDLKFIEDFKCDKCLSSKRYRPNSPPINLTEMIQASNADESHNVLESHKNLAYETADLVACEFDVGVGAKKPVSAQPNVISIDTPVVDGTLHVSSLLTPSRDEHATVTSDMLVSLPTNCSNNSQLELTSNNSVLQLLLSEIRSLKLSNESLNVVVSSLRSDNAKLMKKVEEMHDSLSQILNVTKQEKITSSSPKRKKKYINKIELQRLPLNMKDVDENSAKSTFPKISESVPAARSNIAEEFSPQISYAKILVATQNNDNNNTCLATNDGAGNNASWIAVNNNKRSNKHKPVLGTINTDELGVYNKFKWLHI